MMITKPPKVELEDKGAKVDLEEKIISEANPPAKLLVKCPVEAEAIRNLKEVKQKADSEKHGTMEIDQGDIADQSVEANELRIDESEAKGNMKDIEVVENNAMESETAEEIVVEEEDVNLEKTAEEIVFEGKDVNLEITAEEIVVEEKYVNLEMSWKLKKWPSLPSLLNR